MCEYCGCQAVRTIDELTREHDHVVSAIQLAALGSEPVDLAGLGHNAHVEDPAALFLPLPRTAEIS